MKRFGKTLISAAIFLCLVAFFSAILFPAGTPQRKKRVLQNHSAALLGFLGADVERHIEKTGKRPLCLADIVREPSNMEAKATYFIIPGREKEAEARSAVSTNDFQYEDYADYILETNRSSEVLIYEKPGVRGDNTVYYYKAGFGVWKLKQSEFKKCLEVGKFPPARE